MGEEFDWTSLMLSLSTVKGDHHPVVKYALEHGADVNAKDDNGFTALINSSFRQKMESVRILVEHGADVNIKGRNEMTALNTACIGGWVPVVKYLLEHGANPNVTMEGFTPLHNICTYPGNNINHMAVMTLLIHHGANVSQQDPYLMTPLARTCFMNKLDLFNILMTLGAKSSVNFQDVNGMTPLHLATIFGCREMVKVLLDNGADVTITDKDGQTPEMLARDYKKFSIASMIIEQTQNVK